MSAAKNEKVSKNDWQLTGSWAGAWKVFAGIGGLGLVGSIVLGLGDLRRFGYSWLFAVICVLAVALGMTFFVLIQRLTSAGWSVTVRRTAEFFMNGLLVMIVLALPILGLADKIFPWASGHGSGGHDEMGGGKASITMPALIKDAHAQTHESAPMGATSGAANPQPADKDPHPTVGGTHGIPQNPHETGDPAGKLPGAEKQMPRESVTGHGGDEHVTGAHGGASVHGDAKAHAEHEAHEQIEALTLHKKSGYLSKGFFYGRAIFYFLIWAILATQFFGWSTAQDGSKDPKLTLKAQAFSAPGTFLFGITLTFAAFDWIMSLEPGWFSTIFGVYYFATGVVSSLAVLILVTMALRDAGPLKGAVTVEHFHDLGKLLFGFNIFWAYIGFSQFMLIWYAALPEETTWYHNRWDHAPWPTVSLAILFGHFVLPFLWLISRNFKRNLWRLKVGAAVLLVMHVVDIYWFVMPNFLQGKDGFTFHILDLTCLMAVAGIYGAFVFFRMTKFSLVPVGDPRLARSIEFQNA